MAIFNCLVKHDGVYYPAGTNVPVGNKTQSVKAEIKIKETPKVVEETLTELPFTFTKTDINRLSTKELKQLAKEQGFEGVDEKSGSELKRMLIQKNGL